MDNMQEKEAFRYTYSAKEQEELRRIREKYLPAAEDKMEQLRRLDNTVTRKGTLVALIVGILEFGKMRKILLHFPCCCVIILRHNAHGAQRRRSVPHPDVPDGGCLCPWRKNQGGI